MSEERSKATAAPKCKTCNQRHWGTCLDHDARGAVNDQAPRRAVPVPHRQAARGAAVTDPQRAAPRTSIPTLAEIKDATAALERAFPAVDAIAPDGTRAARIISPSSNGRTSAFGTENLGSSPGGEAKPKRKRALPIATIVTSPRGISARVHGDKPLDPKSREALGGMIDAATDALKKTPHPKRNKLRELKKMADDASKRIAEKPKRGRPKTVDDRKAYKAENERKRRARRKQEGENP